MNHGNFSMGTSLDFTVISRDLFMVAEWDVIMILMGTGLELNVEFYMKPSARAMKSIAMLIGYCSIFNVLTEVTRAVSNIFD